MKAIIQYRKAIRNIRKKIADAPKQSAQAKALQARLVGLEKQLATRKAIYEERAAKVRAWAKAEREETTQLKSASARKALEDVEWKAALTAIDAQDVSEQAKQDLKSLESRENKRFKSARWAWGMGYK